MRTVSVLLCTERSFAHSSLSPSFLGAVLVAVALDGLYGALISTSGVLLRTALGYCGETVQDLRARTV